MNYNVRLHEVSILASPESRALGKERAEKL